MSRWLFRIRERRREGHERVGKILKKSRQDLGKFSRMIRIEGSKFFLPISVEPLPVSTLLGSQLTGEPILAMAEA